jgi:hypothetical protein
VPAHHRWAFLFFRARINKSAGYPVPIKAIPTRYAGRAFRSRLEARWAVLLDHVAAEWQHEPQGFDLGEHGCYLPDFSVQPLGRPELWLEVKPKGMHYAQLQALARETETHAFVVGEPALRSDVIAYLRPGFALRHITVEELIAHLGVRDRLDTIAASNKALSARFEHGETPRRPAKPGGRGPRAYVRPESLLTETRRDWSAW